MRKIDLFTYNINPEIASKLIVNNLAAVLEKIKALLDSIKLHLKDSKQKSNNYKSI